MIVVDDSNIFKSDVMVEKILYQSKIVYDNPRLFGVDFPEGLSEDEKFDLIVEIVAKLFIEKKQYESINDSCLEYDDEIISIEEVEERELMDISVSQDSLFYANGILTKNSIGVPQTLDMMLALIASEEMEELGQIMVKVLKNRFNDPTYYRKFVLGVERSKMRFYDAEESASEELIDNIVTKAKTNKPATGLKF